MLHVGQATSSGVKSMTDGGQPSRPISYLWLRMAVLPIELHGREGMRKSLMFIVFVVGYLLTAAASIQPGYASMTCTAWCKKCNDQAACYNDCTGRADQTVKNPSCTRPGRISCNAWCDKYRNTPSCRADCDARGTILVQDAPPMR